MPPAGQFPLFAMEAAAGTLGPGRAGAACAGAAATRATGGTLGPGRRGHSKTKDSDRQGRAARQAHEQLDDHGDPSRASAVLLAGIVH